MSFVPKYRLFIEQQAPERPVHLSARFTSVVVMTTDVIKRMESALSQSSSQSSNKRSEKPERISEAEHAVMEVLWDRGTATAAEVCEAICEKRDWSLATVKTLLSRLVQKNAIAPRPDGRRFLYTPQIARADYVGGESRRLVDRLFGGRAASLVAHLAETEALSEDDVSEIEALLKELKS